MATLLTLPAYDTGLSGKVGYGVVINSNKWDLCSSANTAQGVLVNDASAADDYVTACIDGECDVMLGETVTAIMSQLWCANDGTFSLAGAGGETDCADALETKASGSLCRAYFRGQIQVAH